MSPKKGAPTYRRDAQAGLGAAQDFRCHGARSQDRFRAADLANPRAGSTSDGSCCIRRRPSARSAIARPMASRLRRPPVVDGLVGMPSGRAGIWRRSGGRRGSRAGPGARAPRLAGGLRRHRCRGRSGTAGQAAIACYKARAFGGRQRRRLPCSGMRPWRTGYRPGSSVGRAAD